MSGAQWGRRAALAGLCLAGAALWAVLLSAEPAEPEGKRHRAPHIRFELHRVERHLKAREPRCAIAPECQPRLVSLNENRLQPESRPSRTQLGHQ